MQRIFLIHGWGGSPKNDWFPWAKNALEKAGYEVLVPEMPDTEHPKITPWVQKLANTIGEPKSNDILIGHSIGCQTILRYLDKLDSAKKVGKLILIAPWWFLTIDESEADTAKPWLNIFVDFEKVKRKADKIVCVFSENDPFVPLNKNVEFFKQNLNPDVITKAKSGHFTEDDGVTKLDFLIDLIK